MILVEKERFRKGGRSIRKKGEKNSLYKKKEGEYEVLLGAAPDMQ